MGKYLKLFETHTEYEEARQNLILPNVSLCAQENEVHYNPLTPPPMNIIRYEASEKLTETTSDKSSGLHTNKFNTTIVSHTFENGVGTIEFEEDVTTIYKYAFYNCGNMTSIDLPNSVTSICIDGNVSDGAFQYCYGLTSITIPNSVTTIGKCTFMNSGLISIDIPNNVTTIGSSAFSNCSGLTSVTIPSGVTSIGRAFGSCANLESIVVNNSNTTYDSRNNCNAIIETATNTLINGCKNTIIPEGITSIGQAAFLECSGLTSITIPNSVTSIGDGAFNGCRGLTSINIPSGVTTIGDSAFNLCSYLTSITVEATTPPTLGSSTFLNTNNCPIYVPAASVETYKAASNWSYYASRIQAIPTA